MTTTTLTIDDAPDGYLNITIQIEGDAWGYVETIEVRPNDGEPYKADGLESALTAIGLPADYTCEDTLVEDAFDSMEQDHADAMAFSRMPDPDRWRK